MTAIKWLMWNKKVRKQELGFVDLDLKNDSHLWFLQAFFMYGIFDNSFYYTKNLVIFFYCYFIRKHKNIRLALKKKDIFWIKAPQFVLEVNSLSDNQNITKEIYNSLYRR